MGSLLRILGKALLVVSGIFLLAVVLSLGYCSAQGWLLEREWNHSKDRIKISEVEIFDVKLESDPQAPTDVVFTGFVRNRSAKYLLADVNVQVVFQDCEAAGTACTDIRPWVRNSLGAGWRLPPGKSAEFRYFAFLGDPPPILKGKLVAHILITSVRGLEP